MTASLKRLIHVGCRELGLDQDSRHALQVAETGKASMSDMTEDELNKIIIRLKADGFKPYARKTNKRRATAPRADLRLCHVLWAKLGEVGALERPGRAGLNAFIRAQFGDTWHAVPADIDMLRDHKKIDAVIQALKAWGKREDIDFNWETP